MKKKTPKYVMIYHEIKSDIIKGRYTAGAYLPPEGELEKIYDASRTTIRSAVSLLKDEHIVDVKQGKGTEILPALKHNSSFSFSAVNETVSMYHNFLVDGAHNFSAQGATVDVVEAGSVVAGALNINIGEKVCRLQRVKYINDIVFCYAVSYVPYALAPGMEKHSGEIVSLYKYLKENHNINYTSSKLGITVCTAGFLESKLLNISEGDCLLKNKRVAYDNELPFEYNESVFRPDIMEFGVNLSVMPPEQLV